MRIEIDQPKESRRGSRHNLTREQWRDRVYDFTPRGSELPQARLTEDQVRAIRRNAAGRSARAWAAELGVHVRTIEKVQRYESWRHVT